MNDILKRVFDYCDEILHGKIKACQEHVWAVRKFIKDYESCLKEDSLFYFDENELDDFYWWSREHTHAEGVLAGETVNLTDWQMFNAANILSFKKKANNARKIRNVYIQVARKNAKSQFLALIADYICFLGNEKQRAYIAGWTRDQSSEVYEAVRNGIAASELLKGKWKESYGKIVVFNNNSVIIPLSKEARKTGDGKNPSVGIIDEYHAHETSEIYDVLKSGMVARREPLMFIITTAGFDLSRPCFTEYNYVRKLLNPDDSTENDDYYVMICQLDKGDDIKDESNWIKANPIVATYSEGIESLRSELNKALAVPEQMRSYLTKNMNIWVDMKENGYMDMSKWKACKEAMVPLAETSFYLGIDLSLTTDLTSVGWVGVKDGLFYVGQHSFMPEERMKEKMTTDKVRYDLWEEWGYLSLTPGETVDYKFVEDWILSFIKNNRIQVKEIGYDRWKAEHISQDLQAAGFVTVEIPQRISMLTLPTTGFREKVYEKKVVHDGDPLLEWAISNAVTKTDDQENMMISKKVSKNRIDPIASIINAYARAMYDNHGIDLNAHILSGQFSF